MIITYQGASSVKVQFGDITLAFNPVSKDSKEKSSRFGADIALISTNHPDFNGIDNVSFGEKKAFSVTGPGEYEIKGVFIKGFESKSLYADEEMINTIYTVNLENMNLCFLGVISDKDLPVDANEDIESVDVLFVPVGIKGSLSPSDSYKLAVKMSPKIIIPLYWGDKDALKLFLKEAGEESVKAEDKLVIKKKDLEGKEGDVVVLSSQS